LAQPLLRALKHRHSISALIESYNLEEKSSYHHIKTTHAHHISTTIKLLQTTTHLVVSPWNESYSLEELIPLFGNQSFVFAFMFSKPCLVEVILE